MTTPDEPLVATAPVEDVLAAIESADLDAPWEEVAPSLCVALPRRRALPVAPRELATHAYSPGIETVLGLDIGPATVAPERLTASTISPVDWSSKRASNALNLIRILPIAWSS